MPSYRVSIPGLFRGEIIRFMPELRSGEFNFQEWEREIGGFELIIPRGERSPTTFQITEFIPYTIRNGNLSAQIIAPVKANATKIYIATADYTANADALIAHTTAGYSCFIRNEAIQVTAKGTDSGGAYLTVTRGNNNTADPGTDPQNYYLLEGYGYEITKYPTTLAGFKIIFKDYITQNTVKIGRIQGNAIFIGGAVFRIKGQDIFDFMDAPVPELDPTRPFAITPDYTELSRVFNTDENGQDFLGEFRRLPMRSIAPVYEAGALVKKESFKSFKEALNFYLKLTLQFLQFSETTGIYEFLQLDIITAQNASLEPLALLGINSSASNIKIEHIDSISEVSVQIGSDVPYRFINPRALNWGDRSKFELKIPDGVILDQSFSAVNYAARVFALFGSLYRTISITSIPPALSSVQIGEIYTVSDRGDLVIDIADDVDFLLMCTGKDSGGATFIAMKYDIKEVISPGIYTEVTLSSGGFVVAFDNTYGELYQFLLMETTITTIEDAVQPDTDYRYFDVGYKLQWVEEGVGGINGSGTITSISGNQIAISTTDTLPGVGDKLWISYARKSTVSGDQLDWAWLD